MSLVRSVIPSLSFQEAKNVLHGLFPLMGAARFGILGERMAIVGITGTDGKSSSVELTAAMLRAAGHRVAHYSSISFHDGRNLFPNDMKMTTPGRMELHRFLHRAMENGCTHAVLEVTSQGMLQHRHRMIGFSLVGITNITPEHIEAHGGFDRYRAIKASIVDALKEKNLGLVIPTETYESIKELIPQRVCIYKTETSDGELHTKIIEDSVMKSIVEIGRGGETVRIESKLGGPFAAKNIVFAAHMAARADVSLACMRFALEAIDMIPGRFEIVSVRPLVIVDYAHTVHALEVLLPYVRAETSGRLIHVFGAAGGGRDRYKRPLIARISERSADVSILTEENSFDEPIEEILHDIRAGFSPMHPVHSFPHREDAVAYGYGLLQPNDTLLLTAKGSESVIAGAHGSKRAYSERTYIRCLVQSSSES